MKVDSSELKSFLDRKVVEYNNRRFIQVDPIAVPHRFTRMQDIEIAGFFSALIAWGQRRTIIANANRIMAAMDEAPFQFITQHQPHDLKRFLHITHRTFQPADLLFLIQVLRAHYKLHDSLEAAFCLGATPDMKSRLTAFHSYVFSFEHLERTKKHIASPAKHSACKRLNMFLRWMVRSDNAGVDFGIWKRIAMHELICPLDTHVMHVAHRLGLLHSGKANWASAEELTANLREFNPHDPCQYDFALFGLGNAERVR
jgi:uncharacterized protein (TIGR02757 family)